MKQTRNLSVDFLRGFAVILIILIHVTVYFRNNPLAAWLWEYSQVAVPIFVFCSAYVYFSRPDEVLSIQYFTKRIKRLIIPYYFFLLALFTYTFVLKGQPISFETIMRKVAFLNMNSRDLDWLVILFLSFMVLMPFIRFLSKKPLLFTLFTLLSLFSSIGLLFVTPNIPFRAYMWLPWSIVLIVSYFIAQFEKSKWVIPGTIGTFFLFYVLSKQLLLEMGKTLTLTANKYPPNIFYLSYGIFLMIIIYYMYNKFSLKNDSFARLVTFLSTYSYSIFFIHFLLLYFILDFVPYKTMEWWHVFGIVLFVTLAVQWSINKVSTLISSRH